MKMFLKRTKGSITVMVTLILVPTIFFNGFMVDLARIKLYSSQAVMAADNYGQAILTDYDNLLKELYGLFAVSQNEEGEMALEKFDTYMQGYMQSSFKPNENTISWKHLQSIFSKTSYEGFMPYQQADIEFSYTNVKGANLGNSAVFNTQVGDFMKFRIAQTLVDDEISADELLGTVFTVQDMGNMAGVISKKDAVCEKVAELLDNEVRDYYEELKDLEQYREYLDQMNEAYAYSKKIVKEEVASKSYQLYRDNILYAEEIEAALRKKEKLDAVQQASEVEELTEEEEYYIRLYEECQADEKARKEYFEKMFSSAIMMTAASTGWKPVDFSNFDDKTNQLRDYAVEIYKKIEDIRELYEELQQTLEDTEIDESVKAEIKEDMSVIELLFKEEGEFSADNYVKLADLMVRKQEANEKYYNDMQTIISTMEDVTDEYLNPVKEGVKTEWANPLNADGWTDFMDVPAFEKLYTSLKQCFTVTDEEASEKGKKKQKEAETAQKESEEKLKNEPADVRDIPETLMLRGTGMAGSEEYNLMDNIDDAAAYFSINKILESANDLLLKLYTVQYDMGMFSSRVTNVKEGDAEESLTGYPLTGDINYLYKAELEYILGGNNSSQKNLDEARNMILGFRAVINYTSTYSIKPVNSAIRAITAPLNAINPLLAVTVSSALRAAVAGMETASDWVLLMDGESVVLWKSEIGDMTAGTALEKLLDINIPDMEKSKFSMSYRQYLMVMLIFMTTSEDISERTADVITLNINTVKQKIGADGELSELTFTMDHAVTAINATCKVHMDCLVMPWGFAKQMTSAETYHELQDFEKNSYQFTVTRGY